MLRKHVLSICCLILIVPAIQAQQQWPQTIEGKNGGKITLYQPQPESMNGNILNGRAAFSVRQKPTDDPVFGALWYTATMETNRMTTAGRKETVISGSHLPILIPRT